MPNSFLRHIFIAAIAGIVLSACASGPRDRGAGRGFNLNQAYATATELHARGKCREAAAIYFQVAMQGKGYEDAQYRLGECLIRLAGTADFSTDYLEGLVWLRRAAEAGWPEAQGALAVQYLEGPQNMRNPVEAAMWLNLYENNIGQKRLGFTPLATASIDRLKTTLNAADRAEGDRLAQSWRPVVWKPIASIPAGGRASRDRERDEFRQDGRRRPDGQRPQSN